MAEELEQEAIENEVDTTGDVAAESAAPPVDPLEMAQQMINAANMPEDISDDEPTVASEEDTGDAQAASTDDESGEEESHEASVQQRAKVLGISESLAKRFDSVPELEKYVLLMDELNGFKPGTTSEEQEKPAEKAKAEPAKVDPKAAVSLDDDLPPVNIDVAKLREDGESDYVISMAEALNKLSERDSARNAELKSLKTVLGENPQALLDRIQAVESRYQAEIHRQTVDYFDSIVDSLDRPEFGKTLDKQGRIVPLPETAKAKRQELWDAATTLAEIQQKKGNDMPIEVLVQRALLQLASPQEVEANARKSVLGKLQGQSKKRLGSSAGTAKPVVRDSAEERERELVAMASRMIH